MKKTYVISRRIDVARRELIKTKIPAELDWRFFDATDGHRPETVPVQYRHLVRPHFWGATFLKPGAVGCYISHYRVWEQVLKDQEPAIIIEDDVEFSDDLSILSRLHESDSDILMLNKRTADWVEACEDSLEAGRSLFPSVHEVVDCLTSSNRIPPRPRAAGSDCYYLTVDGAKRLTQLADLCGIALEVDWFLVGAGLRRKYYSGEWKTPGLVSQILGAFEFDPLLVKISRSFLIATAKANGGDTTIDHSWKMPCEDYISRIQS